MKNTILFLLIFSLTLFAQDDYNYISINNILMWIGNNGSSAHHPVEDNGGFFWPDGSLSLIDPDNSTKAIYCDGILIGGRFGREIRIEGAHYRYGLQPGIILPSGQADDPWDPKYKIWKIRKEWDLLPPGNERDRFEYDYNNWPMDIGAPYEDKNNDGLYSPGIDEPKFLGDETLYFVSNDLDVSRTTRFNGNLPIGLEFHTSIFGFNRDDYLSDAVFKKCMIINKSDSVISNTHISYWIDDDIGNYLDDYMGCDSTLNLGFTYNSDNYDEDIYVKGYLDNPPAVGHMLLQGPKIMAGANDSAYFCERWIKGYKNLQITSCVVDIPGDPFFGDPHWSDESPEIIWNRMQGFLWNGGPIINPITETYTKFCLSGDPDHGTGWYEGEGWPDARSPGDRRYLMSSGPFTMTPGDTQEVAYAIFIARGNNNLNSVTKLKSIAQSLKELYYTGVFVDVKNNENGLPSSFSLEQNYPNPFNPATNIEYSLPAMGQVKLIVYDILGRVVETIVDKEQKPGTYKVEFNVSKLASGVYFYRMQTGSYGETKKMVLLK